MTNHAFAPHNQTLKGMHIEIRVGYRRQSRTISYTKADFERIVTPLLNAHNAEVTGTIPSIGAIAYRIPIKNKKEALTFRAEFHKRMKRLDKAASYGFNFINN